MLVTNFFRGIKQEFLNYWSNKELELMQGIQISKCLEALIIGVLELI